jgi:hypothetical protein
MMHKLMFMSLLLLAPRAWAQEEKTSPPIVLAPISQLTIQGLYGENKLVRTTGNPLLGATYSRFGSQDIHIGDWEDAKKKMHLHLPNFGWYTDFLTGSRSGTRVNSFGIGAAVRLTSTALSDGKVARDRWFYGMGLGLYATRVEAVRSSTGIGLGSRFFLGKDFSDGTLIEAGYSYRPGTQGVHPSGLSIGLGRRF